MPSYTLFVTCVRAHKMMLNLKISSDKTSTMLIFYYTVFELNILIYSADKTDSDDVNRFCKRFLKSCKKVT